MSDKLLQAYHDQERTQRFLEISLLVNLLASGFNISPETIQASLLFYEKILTRKAFEPGELEKHLANQAKGWTKDIINKAISVVDTFDKTD